MAERGGHDGAAKHEFAALVGRAVQAVEGEARTVGQIERVRDLLSCQGLP